MPTEDWSWSSGVGILMMSSYKMTISHHYVPFLEQLNSNSLGIRLQYEVSPCQIHFLDLNIEVRGGGGLFLWPLPISILQTGIVILLKGVVTIPPG